MEKILIVEDNKALANLIAKKIKNSIKFEVDIAYSMQEAKLFMKAYKYFITLANLHLLDAPNGEIVDYALSKAQHLIVLSNAIDKEFRKTIMQKDIIDYVTKDGVNDINYIISTIDRLNKNKKHKVLVVDDSLVTRQHMQKLLKNLFFDVISVAHGEEAIGMLKAKPDISLVLTDYNMPVMNGLELTDEIRKSYKKNELSIIALSSNGDDEINAMFLKHGANDYIQKPFSKEAFSCRINNTIEALENYNFVINHANRDFLTGLYNRRYFDVFMADYLNEIALNAEKFALAMINIDNFKSINDTYGYEIGDKAIVHLSKILSSTTNHQDIIARFAGEEFCVVLKNVNRFSAKEIFERIRTAVAQSYILNENLQEIQFTISIGAVLSSDDSLEDHIAEADMMLYKAKQDGRNRVAME